MRFRPMKALLPLAPLALAILIPLQGADGQGLRERREGVYQQIKAVKAERGEAVRAPALRRSWPPVRPVSPGRARSGRRQDERERIREV